jgi:uncharacterized protein YecE (DUF72 family)
MSRMAIYIGCGSWADAEYTEVLYPRGLPANRRLNGYAKWFDHVEVNSTYYATPRIEIVENWVAQTPAAFRFDIKLHRAFSQGPHKAATEGKYLAELLAAVQPLLRAKKLGTFLLVLAPHFGPGRHRLEELDALVDGLRPHSLAVELRHSDWVDATHREPTLAYFRARKLAWVAVDMPRIKDSTLMPPVDEVTLPGLAYLRLHGRNPGWLKAKSAAERHVYAYSELELQELGKRITKLAQEARDVHVVANNHARDFAPKTALALKRLLGQPVPDRAADLFLK